MKKRLSLQDARVELKQEEYLKLYLSKKGIDPERRFQCLSKKHEDNNPSMSCKYGYVKCFGCDYSGDIFDLIGMDYGLSSFYEKLVKACSIFDIAIDYGHTKVKSIDKPSRSSNNSAQLKNSQEEVDYTDYIKRTTENLKRSPEALQYLLERGFSKKVINNFILGYDSAFKHPKNKKMHPSKRIIISDNPYSFTARAIDGNPIKYFKVGKSMFFNEKVLNQLEPVFITEGEFDALSIIEVGGIAMAIGSTSNVSKLIKKLKTLKIKSSCLVVLFDNDETGEKAAEELVAFLQTTNFDYKNLNICGKYKDVNECLQKDRRKLEKLVADICKEYFVN